MVKHTCLVLLKAQGTQPQGNPLTSASLVTAPPETTATHGAANLIVASITTHKHTWSKQQEHSVPDHSEDRRFPRERAS